MVTAVKKKYENTFIEHHPEEKIYRLSDRGHLGIVEHPEEVIPRLSHRGHSDNVDDLAAVSKLLHMGNSIMVDHLGAVTYRRSLEGNLCAFCYTLDERRIENRFAELVAEWRRGTGGLSSPRAIASHPAYQQIIQMGETALPLIFQELRDNGGWWYPALRALTGKNPVPEEARGKPPLNREAWLEWGRRNGYLQS
jgi:hypothetical protein